MGRGEFATAARVLLHVDGVRVCVREVTLVLYKRCPGLLAGGSAAETGQDIGEGCRRKGGGRARGQCPSIDGRVGSCVPNPPQKSSLLSGLHLHRVQGGSDLVFGACLQTGKPSWKENTE